MQKQQAPMTQQDELLAVDIAGYPITEVSPADYARQYGGFIAKSARNSARRLVKERTLSLSAKPRTTQVVSSEYDQGSWKQILDDRRWERVGSLREFMTSSEERIMTALIEGKLMRIKAKDYYDYRQKKLHKIVSTFADEGREFVEAGAGWGMNLFSLYDSGFQPKMRGYDISVNGVNAGNTISKHFDLGIEFGLCNLLTQDIPDVSDTTVMTYYCFEQLKYYTEQVIERIHSWSPKRVIHIEPVIELYQPWRLQDVASHLYIRYQDYQQSLLTTIQKLEKAGKAKIVDVRRLGYAANPLHEGSLIVWEPR